MNANYKSITLAISLLFALSTSISAAPGDLDLTFGSGGKVITRGSTFNTLDTALAMAIQSDGKIVVVGDGATSNTWDFAVVRYNTDGSLDSSFGGGIVLTPVGNSHDQATSVAIQADGKIVVAGSICNGVGDCGNVPGNSFAVVRYNPNGSLDTSFNGTGKVITSVGSSTSASELAIQADGKIVVAGSSRNGSNDDFALVRFNADGSLDTTFNGTGKVITPIGGGFSGASSVAIQSDGKIIAAGQSQNGFYAFTLVRYNTDGTLDTSFNGTGIVITSVGNSDSGASKLAIQTDGKIVVVGYSNGATADFRTADFAVVRCNPNGSLDTSFGGTGKIITPIGNSYDYANSVAIQSDGKIVAVGYSGKNIGSIGSDFAVVRFNPNGSLDTTFNGTGIVITPVGNAQDFASAVAIQTDGKIVVAGGTDDQLYDFYDFVVVRYQGDDATPAACPNPVDCADFFVRQHYRDFLGREPDDAGLAFWTSEITSCGSDAGCVEAKRVNVSAAFFLSIEFQNTGYLVERMHKASYGDSTDASTGLAVPVVRRTELVADSALVGQGVVVNSPGWEQLLEANKQAYALAFVRRQRFTDAYPPSMAPAAFVAKLNENTGGALTQAEVDALVAELSADQTAEGRASVLRKVAENAEVDRRERNRAFVLMQYFGYLRRDPDAAPDANYSGYQFWLSKLNQFNGNFVQAEMVRAFISSIEYRRRFGQP